MTLRRYHFIIALLLLFSVAIVVILQSHAALQWLWKRVEAFSHQAITAQRIDGVLAGPIAIEGLQIRLPSSDIAISSGRFDWHPGGLLSGRLSVIEASAADVIVTLHPSQKTQTPASNGLSAPFGMSAGKLAVNRLVIRREGASDIYINNIVIGDAVWRGDLVSVDRLALDSPWGSLSLRGKCSTRTGMPIDLQTRFVPSTAMSTAPLELSGQVKGTLGHPSFTQQLSGAVQGSINGDIVWSPGPLHWQAVIDANPFSLQRLRPSGRALVVGGHLEGSGDFLRNELHGTLTLDDRAFGKWHGTISLKQDREQIDIVEAQLRNDGHAARIDGHGKLRLAAAPGYVTDADLRLRWRDLVWPISGHNEKVRSSDGTAHLTGSPDDYRLTTELALAAPRYPASRWQVAGRGDLHHFTSPDVQLQGLDGKASGEAAITWSPYLEWHAHLDGKGLNPGKQWPQWPGRLNVGIRSDGSWKSRSLNITVQSLDGTLRGHPLTGKGRADYVDGRWTIAALHVSSGKTAFSASGALGTPWDLAWQLDAPQLGQFLPDARGRVQAKGTLTGTGARPRITLNASASTLRWKELLARSVTVITDIDLAAQHPWQLRVTGTDIHYGDNTLADQLDIRGDGSAAAHQLRVHVARSDGELVLAAEGAYRDGGWNGTLREGAWTGRNGESLKQESPASITISRTRLLLSPYCWASDDAHGCIEYRPAAAGGDELTVSLRSLPVHLLAQWLPRKDIHLDGKIFAEGHARVDHGLREVSFDAHVESGSLVYHQPYGGVIDLKFKQFEVSMLSKGGSTHAVADIALANGDTMHLEQHMPGWSVGAPLAGNQPVEGVATLSMRDLSWMTLVVPEILKPAGNVSANLVLSGRVDGPRLTGSLVLENGSVSIPRAGLSIKKLAMLARSTDGVSLQLSGAATSGPGWVTIEGNVRGETLEKWHSEFTLRGERFEAIRLPSIHLLASPQIHATVEPYHLDVEGTLQVPESDITLPELPQTTRSSPDVVLVNGTQPVKPAEPWAINTRLTLKLGDYVRLQGYGFKGRIGGQLTITEKPDELATGQGELQIYDGKYKAYGQELTIDSGRLLFANSPIDNPALDVRASRSQDNITVGANITGRLQHPRLSLFSNPAMEESDALAYLVLGHPLRSASTSEAASVSAAATSLGLVGGERIASAIGKQFGIQEVSIGSEYQSKEAALLLGKYLSPRLYLQYSVVFSNAVNVTRLRYELTNHWYLKLESSAQQAADILYTFER